MRQLLHMFYPAVLMVLNMAGRPTDSNEKTPDFRDFHDRIWAREVSLATKEAKEQYARVHMNQFLQNMRKARFQDAPRIVSDRQFPDSLSSSAPNNFHPGFPLAPTSPRR
jgi:hypothetical protein